MNLKKENTNKMEKYEIYNKYSKIKSENELKGLITDDSYYIFLMMEEYYQQKLKENEHLEK